MQTFLTTLLGFPAAAYTVALGAVVIYWAAVLVGAVDLDDGDAHDPGDTHLGLDHDGGVLDALGAIELRRVPLTVRVSLVVIFGWLVAVMGWLCTHRVWPAPLWSLRATLSFASVFVGVRLAGLAARPLVPVFTPKRAPSREDLAGRDAEVTTGRVDTRFGQVLVRDGGAGLLVDARYEGAVALKKGDRVLVTHWDTDRRVVNVEPLEAPSNQVRVEATTEAAVVATESPEASGQRSRQGH